MRFSLLQIGLLLMGIFCIYDGLNRGIQYGPLLKESPQKLAVAAVYNLNGRRILADYVAVGSISNSEAPVVVEIFEKQYRSLKPGAFLDVYHLEGSKRTPWANAEKIEESKPIMKIFDVAFSWHFILGILFTSFATISIWKERQDFKKIFNRPNKRSSPADSGAAPPTGPAE